MKLSELYEVAECDWDLADNTYDVSFYAFINPNNKIAKQIDVVRIHREFVVCDFTKFINENKGLIRQKIYDYYMEEYAIQYEKALDNPKDYEETFCDVIIGDLMRDLLEEE